MARVVHAAVYLRRMDSGNHLVAVERSADGAGPAYLEVPPFAEKVPTHFGTGSKSVNRREEFTFGERVNLTLESV